MCLDLLDLQCSWAQEKYSKEKFHIYFDQFIFEKKNYIIGGQSKAHTLRL